TWASQLWEDSVMKTRLLIERERGHTLDSQIPQITQSPKAKTVDMLRDLSGQSQQKNQSNLTRIERARKNRRGGERSQRELLERIFNMMEDGESRSVSKIATGVEA